MLGINSGTLARPKKVGMVGIHSDHMGGQWVEESGYGQRCLW